MILYGEKGKTKDISETVVVYDIKVYSNGPGHMTKMATMPIYGKNMKNASSLEPKGR